MDTPPKPKPKRFFVTRHKTVTVLVLVLAAVSVWAEYERYQGQQAQPKQPIPSSEMSQSGPKEQVKMTLSNSKVQSATPAGVTVTGDIKNNEDTKRSATVQATFYDAGNKVLGTASSEVVAIEPGKTVPFTITKNINVANYSRMVVEVTKVY